MTDFEILASYLNENTENKVPFRDLELFERDVLDFSFEHLLLIKRIENKISDNFIEKLIKFILENFNNKTINMKQLIRNLVDSDFILHNEKFFHLLINDSFSSPGYVNFISTVLYPVILDFTKPIIEEKILKVNCVINKKGYKYVLCEEENINNIEIIDHSYNVYNIHKKLFFLKDHFVVSQKICDIFHSNDTIFNSLIIKYGISDELSYNFNGVGYEDFSRLNYYNINLSKLKALEIDEINDYIKAMEEKIKSVLQDAIELDFIRELEMFFDQIGKQKLKQIDLFTLVTHYIINDKMNKNIVDIEFLSEILTRSKQYFPENYGNIHVCMQEKFYKKSKDILFNRDIQIPDNLYRDVAFTNLSKNIFKISQLHKFNGSTRIMEKIGTIEVERFDFIRAIVELLSLDEKSKTDIKDLGYNAPNNEFFIRNDDNIKTRWRSFTRSNISTNYYYKVIESKSNVSKDGYNEKILNEKTIDLILSLINIKFLDTATNAELTNKIVDNIMTKRV